VIVIKAGARVRVRLVIGTQAARHHIAMVDFLPAGLEPLNPELKQSSDPESSNNDRTTLLLDLLPLGRGFAAGTQIISINIFIHC
jgi:uncharacterized protein YfaS (alpha-2-macroglobulin family)